MGPAATIIGVRTTPDKFTIPNVQIKAQKIGNNNKVMESQKLSKIEEHVNKMIAILDNLGASK